MTIGQRIFYLLDEKKMTQKEFSDRTGIATTTISDWRKKNTNPGSDKIMSICAALEVAPEYLLAGVTEDSNRGKNVDYMVLPKGTEERELIEMFGEMDFVSRNRMMEYARNISERSLVSNDSENSGIVNDFALGRTLETVIKSTIRGIPEILHADCRRIILYGSCARGDYTDDSDVDIAILTDTDRKHIKKYSSQIDNLAVNIGIETMAVVNYVCLPYGEFERKKTWYPYFMNIEKDGVVLYER